MSQLRSCWLNQRWLNRGLLIACAMVAVAFVLVLLLWILPNAGGDFLGGNVGTTGLFLLILLTGGALLAILVVYSILRVVTWLVGSKISTASRPMKRSSRLLNVLAVIFLLVVSFTVSMSIRPVNLLHFRYQHLFGKRDFYGIDLSGEDLSGANLKGVSCVDADLREANLADADISNGNLAGADLSGADLRGANLNGVNLSGVNFHGTLVDDQTMMDDVEGWLVWEIVNQGAAGRDLSGMVLNWANFAGSDLRGANLSGSDLFYTDLSGADLSEADLSNATLQGANLDDADLSGADVRGAYLMVHWPWSDIHLEGARYDDETAWFVGFDPAAEGAIRILPD